MPWFGWFRHAQSVAGDGYFGLDAGLAKLFHPTERVGVRFRWDVFNVTNSTRFDVNTIATGLISQARSVFTRRA